MIARFVLGFFVLAVAELTSLLWLASRMGWVFALAEVMMTFVIGLAVIRWESVFGWFRWREKIDREGAILDAPLDTMLLLLGGILLMVPGLITDCAGLLLIFPPSRILLKSVFLRSFERKFSGQPSGSDFASPYSRDEPSETEEIVDVEFYRIS